MKDSTRIWLIVLASFAVVGVVVIAAFVALAIQTMAAAPAGGH